MSVPTIGLALIARDEQHTLPNLLTSIEGAFDQVAVLDTGSTDRTVEVFGKWAASEKERHPGFVSTLGHFDWCDDFAAARNAADQLLETDWWCWADCDDVIEGAEGLRPFCRGRSDQRRWCGTTDALFAFPYDLGVDGNNFRARLRRAGVGQWQGRLHEVIAVQDVRRGPEEIAWKHKKSVAARCRSARRNREILRRWMADEPLNLRPVGMLAWSEVMSNDRSAGIELLARYIDIRWAHCEDENEKEQCDVARWVLGELETAVSRDAGRGRPYGPEVLLQILQLALTAITGLSPDSITRGSPIRARMT